MSFICFSKMTYTFLVLTRMAANMMVGLRPLRSCRRLQVPGPSLALRKRMPESWHRSAPPNRKGRKWVPDFCTTGSRLCRASSSRYSTVSTVQYSTVQYLCRASSSR